MRNGRWVRSHYRRSRGRATRTRSGGIDAGQGAGGLFVAVIIIGLILYAIGVLK